MGHLMDLLRQHSSPMLFQYLGMKVVVNTLVVIFLWYSKGFISIRQWLARRLSGLRMNYSSLYNVLKTVLAPEDVVVVRTRMGDV